MPGQGRKMKYSSMVEGVFLERRNRFIARVLIDGREETVHVKNTGRCRELLKPGAKVFLERAANPNRKTAYDLIAVVKDTGVLFNIDSQAPNAVMKEWLEEQDYDAVRPEYRYGNSRMDFFLEKGPEKVLMEVKGCTLEVDGIGYFPDAPTERGIKHLKELAGLAGQGYKCAVGFVIQTEGVTKVLPNMETHPAFGQALKEAEEAGVNVLYLPCRVGEDFLRIDEKTLWPDQ